MSIYHLSKQLLIAGLKELIGQTEQTGVPILIEPLNRYETHFINRVEQAVEICREVGTPDNIRILADFFHEDRQFLSRIHEFTDDFVLRRGEELPNM